MSYLWKIHEAREIQNNYTFPPFYKHHHRRQYHRQGIPDPSRPASDRENFRRGYRLGARVSFDEGTIPNWSQQNPKRTYTKDKPHQYGTECYMTCCAVSGYCARVEGYLGAEPYKKKSEGASRRAVIRNVTKAFDGLPKQRLIIADNFYSSPALALSLLPLGFYYVGTQRTDPLGWPKQLMFKQKKRPQYMPRGTYRIAQARKCPQLVAAA